MELYTFKRRGAEAYAYETENGDFVIKAGSKVSPTITEELKKMRQKYNHRLELEEKGIIKDGVFTQDYPILSPAAAACIVGGSRFYITSWE